MGDLTCGCVQTLCEPILTNPWIIHLSITPALCSGRTLPSHRPTACSIPQSRVHPIGHTMPTHGSHLAEPISEAHVEGLLDARGGQAE